jgi:hypothetical protein
VLTPNGEIKIFAEGAQVFSFPDGRWHLTDTHELCWCSTPGIGILGLKAPLTDEHGVTGPGRARW